MRMCPLTKNNIAVCRYLGERPPNFTTICILSTLPAPSSSLSQDHLPLNFVYSSSSSTFLFGLIYCDVIQTNFFRKLTTRLSWHVELSFRKADNFSTIRLNVWKGNLFCERNGYAGSLFSDSVFETLVILYNELSVCI